MCGIVGLLHSDGRAPDASDLRHLVRMRETMAARGPDGFGLHAVGAAAFGHRRLAIRDLGNGSQPVLSDDGLCMLSYNGELYNDAELRQDLTREAGVRFRTRCDTETVFHACRVWGEEAPARLRGMFAFAYFDAARGELLMARDRCGIKPLYFARSRGTLLFASTVAALLDWPDLPRRPNFAAASHYLTTFRTTLGAETLYQDVCQLRPGERLVASAGLARVDRYADWADENGVAGEDVDPHPPATVELDEAADELRSRLTDAVRVRLTSDVPVGMLMSGGVDSSVLASLLSSQVGAFSAMGGGAADSDDLRFAAKAAGHVGADFRPLTSGDVDSLSTWRRLLTQTRLPCSTPSDLLLYRLAGELRRSVGVVLSGEGADEMLAGYDGPHASARDARPFAGSLAEHFLSVNGLVPSAAKPSLFNDDIWSAAEQDVRMTAVYEDLLGGPGPEERRVYRALRSVNLEGQLARLDTVTMLASLEARVPYCDGPLANAMAGMPWRTHCGLAAGADPTRPVAEHLAAGRVEGKRVLRRLASRLLPDELAFRPKASFPTPVPRLLAGAWAGRSASLLRRSPFAAAVLRPEAIQAISEDPASFGMLLWPLTNLVRWGDAEFHDVRRDAFDVSSASGPHVRPATVDTQMVG